MNASPINPLILTASALENPSIETVCDAAVAAGFDGLSLWPGVRYGLEPHHRRVIDDAGLYVWDVDAVVIWVGDDDPGSPYFEEAPADDVFASAEALGARAINALLIGPRDQVTVESAARAVRVAADRAASLGMTLTVEFARSTAVRTLPEANAIIEASGATNAGILVDTWHHHWSGVSDASFAHVRAIQLSDAPHERPEDFPYATRHRREVPGTGAVDFDCVVNAAPAGTPLIVEVFNNGLLAQHGEFGFAHVLGDAARAVRSRRR